VIARSKWLSCDCTHTRALYGTTDTVDIEVRRGVRN
jgi:hypothetical protein